MKVVSWWHVDLIMNFLLELDADAGNNIKTAEVIDDSLTKIDSFIGEAPNEIMSGLCTDDG